MTFADYFQKHHKNAYNCAKYEHDMNKYFCLYVTKDKITISILGTPTPFVLSDCGIAAN